MIGGRLDRYVLRRFLLHYGLSLLYLVGLFLVVDAVVMVTPDGVRAQMYGAAVLGVGLARNG